MTAKTVRYTLENVNNLIFQGFNYSLPEETLKTISELSLQVGSPDYVKTPVFKKRENIAISDNSNVVLNQKINNNPRRKRGKQNELLNDAEWETMRTFQITKIEEKIGIDAQIDLIRVNLNKLTDKTYSDIREKIIDIIDKLVKQDFHDEDMLRVSTIIFDIASTNRFYSKLYADLYSDLSSLYPVLKNTFEMNLDKFMELFNFIEYVDPNVNYDKFCAINKNNEKRKALGTFYLNLMTNGMITKERIQNITRNLLSQICEFIQIDNKKNEVDELSENVAILYKKEMYEDDDGENYPLINNLKIDDVITLISNSKVKDYKSLTNKTIFKFMDIVDMM
jgi:hypothetical protein